LQRSRLRWPGTNRAITRATRKKLGRTRSTL